MALVVVLVLVSGALLAPGLVVGPSLDAAVFSHIGGRILDGVIPYAAAWDHKPPGIYLASAAAHAFLGWLGPWTADWLLSVAATVGMGLGVAEASSRLGVSGWPRVLGAVGATILAGQYLLALGGGFTEVPATMLVAWALVLALGPSSVARTAWIGALVGVSLLFSIQLLPGAAVVLLLALLMRPRDRWIRDGAAMAATVLLPVAGVLGWLAMIGALPAAIDAVVGYATAYRGSSRDYGAILAAPVAAWTLLASLMLVAPALLGALSIGRLSQRNRAVATGALVWICLSLVLIAVQGRFYAHYAIPLAVPLGILAGFGFDRVAESLGRAHRSGQRTLIALPFVFTVIVSGFAGVVGGAMTLGPIAQDQRRIDAVAGRIGELPEGTLLVWGNQPRLYDVADRVPAIRFSYLYPLTTEGYATASIIEEVALALAAAPPEVIVDAGSPAPGEPGFPPLLIARPLATDGRDLDLLDPLRSFVGERYEFVATVAGWPIYLLRR